VVASRQRAHAVRLAFAASRLSGGARVWPTPDVLTPEAWLIRELEQLASLPATRLPRLLSPAEEWLLWRQCTAEATHDLELLNRAALAESLRRSSALAAEYEIDLSALSLSGAEVELFGQVRQLVQDRCRALGATTVQALIAEMLAAARVGASSAAGAGLAGAMSDLVLPGARGTAGHVVCAGFLKSAPRLEALGARHRRAGTALAGPKALVLAD